MMIISAAKNLLIVAHRSLGLAGKIEVCMDLHVFSLLFWVIGVNEADVTGNTYYHYYTGAILLECITFLSI